MKTSLFGTGISVHRCYKNLSNEKNNEKLKKQLRLVSEF